MLSIVVCTFNGCFEQLRGLLRLVVRGVSRFCIILCIRLGLHAQSSLKSLDPTPLYSNFPPAKRHTVPIRYGANGFVQDSYKISVHPYVPQCKVSKISEQRTYSYLFAGLRAVFEPSFKSLCQFESAKQRSQRQGHRGSLPQAPVQSRTSHRMSQTRGLSLSCRWSCDT